IAHAPGPRGSPQVPQGPNDSLSAKLAPLPPTANTDNRRSSFVPWHEGHTGCCAPSTMVSNCCSHSLHRYSKMGIATPSFQPHCVSCIAAEEIVVRRAQPRKFPLRERVREPADDTACHSRKLAAPRPEEPGRWSVVLGPASPQPRRESRS